MELLKRIKSLLALSWAVENVDYAAIVPNYNHKNINLQIFRAS